MIEKKHYKKEKTQRHQHFYENGISLIELLLVTSLMVWLMFSGYHGLQRYRMRQERTLCLAALKDALVFARSQAFFRNTTVSLCGSHSQERCHLLKDWSTGFIIFENPDRENTPEPHQILRVIPGLRFGTLQFNGVNPVLHISSRGLTMSIGTFLYTPKPPFEGTSEMRSVVVNRVFRSYLQKGSEIGP